MMEILDAVREPAQATGLLAVALFAVFQVRINRLLRKRVEKLEMLVYWERQFSESQQRRREETG